jgi:hypothetical protein
VATIFEGTVATVYGTAKKFSVGLFFFKKSQAQQAFLDKVMSSGRKAKLEAGRDYLNDFQKSGCNCLEVEHLKSSGFR